MIFKSLLPFIAIGLFLLSLLYRKRAVGALGWMFFVVYCASELSYYITIGEYFEGSAALLFFAYTVLLTALMLKPDSMLRDKAEEDLLFTITKISLITAVFYFPFSEIIVNGRPILGELLIYATTKITATMLNLFNVGAFMAYPAHIYSLQNPHLSIKIILDCTAIQSMALFTGLAFGVNAPWNRKFKAFLVSVPTIYVLNIVRNVFVTAAYFEQWFGAQSFAIAHGVLAKIFVMVSLIAVAYAVFMILPEVLDLIDDFFRVILRKKPRLNISV